MTKLISGRVKKIPSANVSASRYDFIKLSETEPDLGLPAANGYVLSGNVDGTRRWILPSSVATSAIFAENANVANTVLSISNFTTANLAEGTNLYYSNARVYANVIGLLNEKANVTDLTTANVAESASNLYYTVARANTAIDNRVTKAFVDNLGISTNIALFAQSANIANTVLSIGNFTTSNLAEGTNLYYSNARVYANVIGLLNTKANVTDLTTANVAESASNLYYTNNRVYANVISLLPNYTGNLQAGNAIIGAGTGGSITGANLISANNISATNWIGLYTANVTESASNLYYTVARANLAIDNRVTKSFIDNLGVSSNTAVFAQTANIANTVLSISNFTTANLAEGTNLYYTNARVRSTLSSGTGVSYDTTTGQISIGQNVDSHANVTFNEMTITGNLNVVGNVVGVYANTLIVNDPLIQLGYNNPSDGLDLGFIGHYSDAGTERHAGVFRDASDKNFKFFDNLTGEPGAAVIDTANATFRLANVVASTFIGNVVGNVNGYVSSISNFSTSNLAEGNNLYYTNARVISAVTPYLTTGNVVESASNLYYTVARANTAIDNRVTKAFIDNLGISGSSAVFAQNSNVANTVLSISNFTTSNLAEGTNLYYTNARVYSNVLALLPTYTGNLQVGNIITSGGSGRITGADFISTNTLVTNTLIINGYELFSNNDIVVNRITANIWNNLYTGNIVETAGNLFYSNDRVRSNVIALLPTLAGSGITIAANGQISSTVGANVNLENINGNVTLNGNLNVTYGVLANTIGVRGNGAPIISSTSNITLAPSDTLFITNKTIIAGNLTVTGAFVTTSNLVLNSVSANVLTTNNLIVNGYELFSNNDIIVNRITANVWNNLFTGNITESATNLFYTNARVRSNVIALLPTLAGPGISIAANGQISSSVAASLGTLANLSVTGNTTSGNVIVLGTLRTNNLIINGSEFFSNNDIVVNRITANIWTNLYTANVIETAGNIFYSNDRVRSNVIALLPTLAGTGITIAANGQISSTGATLAANSVTNDKIAANAISADKIQALSFLTVTGNVTSGNIRVLGTLTTNNLIINGTEFFSNNDIVVNRITANIWTNLYTGNIVESAGNIFYSNDRVRTNVIALLPTLAGPGIAIAANGQISSTTSAGSIAGLNTANVTESASNLYYTNARVYANVLAMLPTYTGNLQVGNIITSGGSGRITGADFIQTNTLVTNTLIINGYELFSNNDVNVNKITANIWTNLYASNVIENGSTTTGNVFFTNTRAINAFTPGTGISISGAGVISSTLTGIVTANVVANLTTSNISEGTNLYYTNNRVYANVITLLPTLAGNNIVIAANGQISATITTAAPSVYATSIIGLNTANVAESASNLYYTNARVYANVLSLLPTYTGNLQVGNIITSGGAGRITGADFISTNTLVTNTLVINGYELFSNNDIIVNRITANIWNGLYTANVIESASNLYFTNARVYANVLALLPTYTGNLQVGNIITSGGSGRITGADYIQTNTLITNTLVINGYELFSNNDIVVNRITANIWTGLYTGNVLETAGNLFYSNDRVRSNVIALLPTLAGSGIAIAANGQISATTSAGSIAGLNTANVAESESNLYYTNTRARAAISAGTGVIYDNSTGIISIGQNVDTHANVTFNTMTVTGNLNVVGNLVGFYANTLVINDPLIQLGYNNPSDALDLGFIGHYNDGTERHAGLFRDASDNKFKFFDNYSVESGAVTIDTTDSSFRLANVVATTYEGNLIGNVTGYVSSIGNFTTSNLAEGDNLYYSNVRTNAAIVAKVTKTFIETLGVNVGAATFAEVSNAANTAVIAQTSNIANIVLSLSGLTTSNLLEGNNLYYTNARVYSNVITLLSTYTGNINAGNITTTTLIANSIIGTAVGGYITGANLISTNNISSLNWFGLYTANVVESASNLYYTNTRVRSNVIALLPTLAGPGIAIDANGIISASLGGVVTANTVVGLTTANVNEFGSNLYYTNARVYANVISLLDAKANVVDLTTANVAESISNLYYTNARVYANVIELLPTYTGNISANNVTTTILVANSIIGTAVGGYITGANLISTNNISSLNWIGLYTANVIESSSLYYTNARVRSNVIELLPTLAGTGIAIDANGIISASLGGVVTANTIIGLTTANVNEFGGNLYYTNARVYANVIGLLNEKANVVDLTTANVIESASNLYFTNARVYANVASMLPTYTGNVTAGNVTTGILYANSVISTATGGYITGANLISTNVISALVWSGLHTPNVIERGDTTTGNVFFTNTRAIGAFTAGTGITITANGLISSTATGTVSANAIVGLTTSNIAEGSNLYYTNARVYANVIGILNEKANVTDLTTANVIESASNLYYTNARVYANVIGLLNGKANVTDLTTANVSESASNLYYTNARVYANVASMLSGYTGDINAGNITTSVLVANSIVGTALGGSITGANLISTNNISSLNWIGLYSSNVVESSSLYYTNARVRANVIELLPTLAGSGIAIDVNGVISASLGGVVTANTIVGLTTANVTESASNLYYTNARVYANVIGLLNGKANIIDLTTANVIESASNLYFTNTRVYSNVSSMLSSYTGDINANNITTSIIVANSIVGTALGGSITGANLISTNNISSLNGTFTGNISVGNLNSVSSITNFGSYNTLINLGKDTGIVNIFSNGAGLSVYPGGAVEVSGSSVIRGGSYGGSQVDFNDITRLRSLRFADVRIETGTDGTASNAWVFSGKTLSTPGNVIVSDSLIANGLIIRGINVNDSVLTGNISAGSTSSDTVTANIITANVWNNLYTANVVETSGNLYFTNTRVVAALVAGDNITIEANGRISSSGGTSGLTQLTVSSSQTLTGGNKNYTLSSSVNNANSIIVSINGMVQAPAIDYTLNGGQGLQFSANTTANALIEVKYYGYSALSPNVAVVSSSVTIPTVAGQAAYMMGANVTQAQSIMVALDGLIQRPTVDYTVNNTTITMIPAPPEGSNIEIRFFGQEAVALAGAQYTTAYISNSRTYAGGSANLDLGSNVLLARNIIVNIDGVTQIPDLNYTVSGNTLSFGTSVPAVGSLVEVKFFGAEAFNANLTQAMVTAVLPTVLSNDTLVRQIIRSSAYAFSRIFY